MSWFSLIKDFKYSHGKLADPDLQGGGGFLGAGKDVAGGFSPETGAFVNLSGNNWKDLLYGTRNKNTKGKYKEHNEPKVIRDMSNTLSHEYGHKIFLELGLDERNEFNSTLPIDIQMGRDLTRLAYGITLGIKDINVFNPSEIIEEIKDNIQKYAGEKILDEMHAGYAGRNYQGITRLILSNYKTNWKTNFEAEIDMAFNKIDNFLELIMETMRPESHSKFLEGNKKSKTILNQLRPILTNAFLSGIDFVYQHLLHVQSKKHQLGELPKDEEGDIAHLTDFISEYYMLLGWEGIESFMDSGQFDPKAIEYLGYGYERR